MTPEQLAVANNEHSHQRAVFAWANMAMRYGFEVANDPRAYTEKGWAAEAAHGIMSGSGYDPSVPDLELLHAIPNGGKRDKVTAAKLKAEGVKAGIPDIFLPVPKAVLLNPQPAYRLEPETRYYCGLYIELKRPATLVKGKRKAEIVGRAAGSTQDEQDSLIAKLKANGYAVSVCFGWQAAVTDIQKYLTGG